MMNVFMGSGLDTGNVYSLPVFYFDDGGEENGLI